MLVLPETATIDADRLSQVEACRVKKQVEAVLYEQATVK